MKIEKARYMEELIGFVLKQIELIALVIEAASKAVNVIRSISQKTIRVAA